ncbi:Xanthine dehydrogenase molybdenum-binding subunit [Anatilimnocola aggregata]|uniref:Xanthine dehydrogenase molybdenum-binding subunit n=1 Tax=Anatilimnocola aggregata TaxID=2528021 RepID=A0A517YGH3_9BACT|nr:xanthine dehydrogenase family protein molybdopterin-binding subunit [Anatilimnocola aggregata]QDU29330.1 Xanthine dehydrogenase molybdenum-binding subunit [Anatilimnocola aggregata]
MADEIYYWPSRDKAQQLGKRHVRLDGMPKSTGAAKYTYDINLKNQLIARALGCPHAHCKIKSINLDGAKKVKGVVHVEALRKEGEEIEWQGEMLAVVAAESEVAAAEGVNAIKIEYEMLESFTSEDDLETAKKLGRTVKGGGKAVTVKEPGDDDDEDEFVDKEIARLLKESAYVVEGSYGIDAITHCCLEPHGSTVEWQGNKLMVHLSTQNVSGTDEGFAKDLNITSDDVEVHCDYIGGGFGSKFAPDLWGIAAARISKATGRPVKFMLTRLQEQQLGGNRPSGYLKVKLGADKDGVIQVWDSEHWGSAGAIPGGVSHTVVPYVFAPKNYRRLQTNLKTNTAQSRAWRAPNHPQSCAMTQTAIDDLARKMGANSYDIFLKNLGTDDAPGIGGAKPSVYKAEMEIAAKLMDWSAKWHPHGKGKKQGSVVEGLGMAIHTWGGKANSSNCLLKIYPDGGVETTCGTQDLGVGTRTVLAVVLAETFGLPYESIKVNIGSSKMPVSGPSGGSTTVGGVCESHRRAGQDAFRQIAELVGKKLGVDPATLEAVKGRVQVAGKPDKGLSWKEACTLIGMRPLEVTGSYKIDTPSPLSSQQVGGVQMAHVAVDTDTGIVKLKKFVAVQDIGLVVCRQQAESQIYGSAVMGIAYALFEQRITDPKTGAFVNAELAQYKLPRIGDIGEVVCEFYEPDDQRSRGVIGIGEPPVISPGAAISNAVCNALGIRVPVLPITPQRVLEALKAKA